MLIELQVLAAEGFGADGEPPAVMADSLRKILGIVSWTVTGTCVLTLFLVAGQMAIAHRRGEGSEHVQGLIWVAGACLLAGSASSIAGVVVG